MTAKLRTPFMGMSWVPDIPSNALAPNEYDIGLNIETNYRGIKKVGGEQVVFPTSLANIFFIDSGFRNQTSYVYIYATTAGRWYQNSGGVQTEITPASGPIAGYTNDTNITTSWVGGVFFINDTITNPMYFAPGATQIVITPDAQWNYELGVTSTKAGFVRNYCSPNVGNINIAGNLTKVIGGNTTNYPTTVRWSQAFANTGIPGTWEPTLSNVANEQEVPVRGPIIDGFYIGTNFYLCSYWDTAVIAPLSYQSTTAPVFGVRLVNTGRGLFNNNCWATDDTMVYGVDSRDIWAFDGSNFQSIANQRVRKYFFDNLNPTYSSRTFMINNTRQYRIEIYYPDLTSTGWCNKMISWRYDLQVWNPPRDIQNACSATEAPFYTPGVGYNLATRSVSYAEGSAVSNARIFQLDTSTSFSGNAIPTLFERTNLSFLDERGSPVPYSSSVYVHRVLPEITGSGTIDVTVGSSNSAGQNPVYGQKATMSVQTDTPWVTTAQNKGRTVSLKVESNNSTDAWTMTAMNWQTDVVEDAF